MALAMQDGRRPMANELWFFGVLGGLINFLSRFSRARRVDPLLGRAIEEAFAEFAKEMKLEGEDLPAPSGRKANGSALSGKAA